jgi:hypothetical protein
MPRTQQNFTSKNFQMPKAVRFAKLKANQRFWRTYQTARTPPQFAMMGLTPLPMSGSCQ